MSVDLPVGWASVEIIEVSAINPKLPFDTIDDDLEVSFLPMKNVEEVSNYIHLDEIRKYANVKKGYTPMINGDVIFAKITPCMENGKIAVVHSLKNGIALGSTEFHVFRCNGASLNKFLFYFLVQERTRQIAAQNMTGAVGQRRVPKQFLQSYSIPLPPLPEQHRIVAKIEELFSSLDKGIESLKTAQQQLKVYRQAVLKWAFEGKLTNVDVKEGELPEGWKWVKSNELFKFVTSGSRGWAKYYADSGAIFIRITNLNFDTLDIDLRPEKIQYVNPPQNSEGIRTKVQEGDFLFSITGYLGMFAIASKLDNAFVNQHVCLCRPKEGFNKKFVGYWIISKSGAHYHLNKNQKGAVKAGLTLDDLKSFPVPLAPLEEQTRIVAEIESRLSVCDKIEESISQSLQQAEALRQSILKKAFEGKLVPQDPTDEPASVLLERIRSGREQQKPVVKKGKVKKGSAQLELL
ncbi:restriction endonuclease subunit S [Telluribacter sp.]|jgi:type I restriction enzyme S subunit|uniref:restriction endonuclease subunit S n=1 Tax=Telluribacter sp. TaxID=1978767 RepID=UPI002E0F481E|nr:restriction endonuclease subunit S [Telluribacter sp.]